MPAAKRKSAARGRPSGNQGKRGRTPGDGHMRAFVTREARRPGVTCSAARQILGRTTSVLFLIVDATPDCGGNVRLVGSKDFFQMPASPVCLDTLVSATVGAAVNLINATSRLDPFPAICTRRFALKAPRRALGCSDIENPLLLPGNSNNMLMRELFPQSK